MDAIPPDYVRHSFVATTSPLPAPFVIPSLLPTSAGLVPTPPLEYFKSSDTPAECTSRRRPRYDVRERPGNRRDCPARPV